VPGRRPVVAIRLAGLLACCLLADRADAADAVSDRTLRFVNQDVITQGDVWERMRDLFTLLRARGEPLPRSQVEFAEYQRESLEALTDEMLLLQEAERLGAQVDEEGIREEVIEWAREQGRPTLRAQIRERRRRIKERKLQAVLHFYGRHWPGVRPADVARIFEERKEEFRRPARVRVRRLLIRPAGAGEIEAVRERMFAAWRKIQADEALAGVIGDEHIGAYLDAEDGERRKILRERLRAALDTAPAEPEVATAALLASIRTVLDDDDGLRDRESVTRTLGTIRERLAAIEDPRERQAAFVAAVEAHSQGPQADSGGDLGWVEPGHHSETFDAVAFETPADGLSEIFWDGGFGSLLLIRDRDDSGVRSLSEVSAAIRAELRHERAQEIQKTLLDQLRDQAYIKDAKGEAALPEEWFEDRSSSGAPSAGSDPEED